MNSVSNDDTQAHPPTLVGATILQIVPALREEPVARTAIDVVAALRQAGARVLVAAEEGPLVGELTASGGEWVPLVNATVNPFRLRRSARALQRVIASERIDIVHAHSAGGAWIASLTAARIAVRLVTTLPDMPPAFGLHGYWAAALTRGDWVITPSNFAAAPVVARYNIPRERLTIIPRSIDIAVFDPAAVDAVRVETLRKAWRIPPAARILLVPGRVAPWNGQLILPDVARMMLDSGLRGFVFVLAGEHRSHRKYAQAVMEQAQAKGVQALVRLTGHCRDLPAALAAADTVVVPATEPPVLGRAVAQAQAMGRPVVTSDIGILPEHVVAPPEMPEEVRTGWVAKRGDAQEFAVALSEAFALDDGAYSTMTARARHFAEYMFSPHSVATATHAVYTALLERDL
ncbi:MAG: glycosyltransferase family 4 protein [Alphaproteobacteria bacterium]|nr:MAG: glycosyltransferase family 4 protein [Alphaproteobacteria bacterium]